MKRGLTTANAIIVAVIVIGSIFAINLFSSLSGVQDVSGNPILSQSTTSSCKWIDAYGPEFTTFQITGNGTKGLPITQVCSKFVSPVYKPIAYELRREGWFYSDSICTNLLSYFSDHQILQNYGGVVPNMLEQVGNLNVCSPLDKEVGPSNVYVMTFQSYDGVLCCK